MTLTLRARDVAALGRTSRLVRFDLEVGAGIHAILGSALDGVGLALAVLAGGVAPTRGSVTVDGVDPRHAAERIAWAPRFAPRADPLRVRDAVRLALDLRGTSSGATSDTLLDRFGLAALAPRKMASLSADEAHLVDTTVALASGASFVLLEEPFAGLDVGTSVRIAETIEALAASGSSIVVATASRREGARLGGATHRLVRGVSLDGGLRHLAPDHVSLLVTLAADEAGVIKTQAFMTAMAEEGHIRSFDAGEGWVRVNGEDPSSLSHAIGRAAVHANVDISSLEAMDPES